MFNLEDSILEWKDHLRSRGGVSETDLEELESHLREEVGALAGAHLDPDESFLVAIKRLGTADGLAGEYAKVNADRIWKQLLLAPDDPAARRARRTEVSLVVALAILAGLLGKIPEILGVRAVGANALLYARNLSFFMLPSVVAYLYWKRGLRALYAGCLGLGFGLPFVLTLLYPFGPQSQTEMLTAIHLPILLWLLVCGAHAGPRWRTTDGRMDFVRASGEAFIYSVLIGLGGGVLVVFTHSIFSSLGLDVRRITEEYLMVMGGCAIPVVAVFLVESKRSIVESIAPVLARIFSPLFLLVLLVFVVVMPITGRVPFSERDFLIAFDIMLALVLALVLYVIAAHRDTDQPGPFEYLSLGLILAALAADSVALVSILGRLSARGITPNKLAALGENLALLVNLTGLAVLYIRYLAGRGSYRSLMRWQTAYLPVYAVWAAIVALGFPPLFGFL
jgi:hypothetical protein